MKVVNFFLHQFSQQHSQAYKYWAMDTILIFLALYATAMAHVQPAYCESNQRGLTDKSMTWPESDWAKKLKGKMPPKQAGASATGDETQHLLMLQFAAKDFQPSCKKWKFDLSLCSLSHYSRSLNKWEAQAYTRFGFKHPQIKKLKVCS